MNWPEQAAVVRVTAKNATGIRKAFDASMNGDAITASWFETHPAGGSVSPQMARDWAFVNVHVNKKPLELALSRIYADGYVLGEKVAKARLLGLTVNKAPTVNVGSVDWANWIPGSASAAALVKPEGGLQELLRTRKVSITDDIVRTKLDRIGTSLASSLERGLGARETSIGINAIINDPQHAMTIARTEMARSMSVATRDVYENSNVQQVEWLVAEGCEDCQENADASPIGIDDTFPSGDSEPPAHPNCMCALAPYFDDSELPAEEAPVEDFPIEDVLAQPDYNNLEEITGQQNIIDVMNQQRNFGFEATPAQLEAITEYTSGSGMYGEVNGYLRAGEFDMYQKPKTQGKILDIVKNLDAVIKDAPTLAENTLTYRGIWGQKAVQFFTNLEPGAKFNDAGFISTSLNKQVAKNFARYDKANGGVLLEIVNPAGTKGIFPTALRTEIVPQYVTPVSENEWLLPRDATFEVVSIEGRTIKVVVK